jgi:3',5'-cyclic-nucleotide phosphodiesterase
VPRFTLPIRLVKKRTRSLSPVYICFVLLAFVYSFSGTHSIATACASDAAFTVIPLGTKGGLTESDLSAYLVSTISKNNFIALDAGTILDGLRRAEQSGSLNFIGIPTDSSVSPARMALQNHIKAYAISHSHIDHLAGMVINSPDDTAKPILGLPSTINNIRDHLFNWKIWPNFSNEGEGIRLNKYEYVRLKPAEEHQVTETGLGITAYPLSHSKNYTSTAFLLRSTDDYLLYFGDVGPDEIEQSNKLQRVWESIAPLVRNKSLRGIFLESSFPSDHPDKLLFGHLTPYWMMKELYVLANLVDPLSPESALHGLKIIVTHIKPSLNHNTDSSLLIMGQLNELNDLNVEFILPKSGKRFNL